MSGMPAPPVTKYGGGDIGASLSRARLLRIWWGS